MCKSKAEGGQRCYAHASAALTKAESAAADALAKWETAREEWGAASRAIQASPGDPDLAQANVDARERAHALGREYHDVHLARVHRAQATLMTTERGYLEAMATADAMDDAAKRITSRIEKGAQIEAALRLRTRAVAINTGRDWSEVHKELRAAAQARSRRLSLYARHKDNDGEYQYAIMDVDQGDGFRSGRPITKDEYLTGVREARRVNRAEIEADRAERGARLDAVLAKSRRRAATA